jgi:DNA-directed RNA polymerase specialized sigma24 family protein
MGLVRDAASNRQFEGFVADASDTLFRTGYLMTGDVRDAEDLVQETFLRVARR